MYKKLIAMVISLILLANIAGFAATTVKQPYIKTITVVKPSVKLASSQEAILTDIEDDAYVTTTNDEEIQLIAVLGENPDKHFSYISTVFTKTKLTVTSSSLYLSDVNKAFYMVTSYKFNLVKGKPEFVSSGTVTIDAKDFKATPAGKKLLASVKSKVKQSTYDKVVKSLSPVVVQ